VWRRSTPAGQAKNAMAVIDAGPSWPDFGEVTGWSELPNAGKQLHTRLDRLLPRAVLPRHHGDHGARWSAAT
jgi:methanethiol oxidase